MSPYPKKSMGTIPGDSLSHKWGHFDSSKESNQAVDNFMIEIQLADYHYFLVNSRH